MEPASVGAAPYPFKGDGGGLIAAPRFVTTEVGTGSIYINEHQYFEAVPEAAWECPVGSYQPAQKWLKDRKGQPLSLADIRHYQAIIKILRETVRIREEIRLSLPD
jgi:hypothetical protein